MLNQDGFLWILMCMKNCDESNDTQFDFWSQNPCGVTGTLAEKSAQRDWLEPWVSWEIEKFPKSNVKFLEVGCGQGVDAFNVCSKLKPSCGYTAIDYSQESIHRCNESIDEARRLFNLPVLPNFMVADATKLPFESGQFDFVYSSGVLHHTPNPQMGVDEIFRVLKDNGKRVIVLYRFGSLKVGIAKAFRTIQWFFDRMLRNERIFYKILATKNLFGMSLGTMLLECFGVPWMHWYKQSEIEQMFSKFQIESIETCGFNFPKRTPIRSRKNAFGYLYKITAMKVVSVPAPSKISPNATQK